MDFDDDIRPEQRQIDAEWVALNAVRETLAIANRGTGDSTYLQALAVGTDAAPRLFDPASSLLIAGQEPHLVREYRERAEAESILSGTQVSPLGLIDHDIAQYERLLEASGGSRDQLRRAVDIRYKAREWFEERVYTENKLITRDVYAAKRVDLPCPPKAGDKFVEYELPFSRALRIRVLHPDRPEHTTGADLIYEFCDHELRKVRLAFVQYKIWDGHTLTFSGAGSLQSQLERLKSVCCERMLCSSPQSEDPPESYRLPYCAAFLRPTDRLQRPDAKLISSGLHVPVCVALKASLNRVGGRVLRRDPIRGRAISQRLFEELFNRNMLGSRWLTYHDVERLYQDHHIFDAHERIVVHAQEFAAV